MTVRSIVNAVTSAKRMSDTELAKLTGMRRTKDLRALIVEAIADGSIKPGEYNVVHSLSSDPAYFLDEHAAFLLITRIDTPQANAVLNDMCSTVARTKPGLLNGIFGAELFPSTTK